LKNFYIIRTTRLTLRPVVDFKQRREVPMVYEWDEQRARRASSIKWLTGAAAILATVVLPALLALYATGLFGL
jgi:hypothetical protein